MTPPDMTFYCYGFDQLTTHQLYNILKLRAQVFMGEQKITDPDVDGVDLDARHVLILASHGDLAGYIRLYQKTYQGQPVVGLGRIVIHPNYRGKGLGGPLVTQAMAFATQWQPGVGKLYMSAQAHLQVFYENCGFTRASDLYDDAGIPHIDMVADV